MAAFDLAAVCCAVGAALLLLQQDGRNAKPPAADAEWHLEATEGTTPVLSRPSRSPRNAWRRGIEAR